MLIAQLPPESATSTALRLESRNSPRPAGPPVPADPESEQWSRAEQLLASVRDELHFIRYGYLSAHSKSRPRWKPEPLPRPGIAPIKKREALTAPQTDVLWEHLRRTQNIAATNN